MDKAPSTILAKSIKDGGKKHLEERISISEMKRPTKKKVSSDDIYLSVTHGFKKFVTGLSNCKIEVLCFIYMFAYIIRSVSSMTMIMDKVCRVHKGFSEEICSHIHNDEYKSQKAQVQEMANNYHLAHTLIQTIPSALLSPFIGPWSDLYGRKLPIIISLCGFILDGIGSSFTAHFMDSRVEFYLLPAIFTGLSGGFITVFTVVYSFVTDTTPPKNRTFKYALMEMAVGLGAPLGGLTGGWIFNFYGYVPVFATSVVGHSFGLLWVIFFLEETRGLDCKDTWRIKIRKFFSTDRLMESVRASTEVRPNRGRLQIWLLLMAASVSVLAMLGSAGIAYLYTYHHYSWGNTKYSTVHSVFSIMNLFAMLAAVPLLTKVFKVGDPVLGIVGSSSSIAKFFGISMASHEGLYYLANLLGLVSGLATLAGRSRISKIVAKKDLGKVFAFLTTIEALIPIAATSGITQLFNSTIGVFPDPSYLGLASVLVIALLIYIWLLCQPPVNYGDQQDDDEKPNVDLIPTTEL